MADQPLKEPDDNVPTVENRPRRSFWNLFRLPFGKAHRIDKFYRQQSDLLESYENDKCQIQVRFLFNLFATFLVFQVENNRRSLRISNCDDDPQNELLPNEQNEETVLSEIAAVSSKVHPTVPRVTERRRFVFEEFADLVFTNLAGLMILTRCQTVPLIRLNKKGKFQEHICWPKLHF